MNQDLTECEKKRNFGFAWQSPAGYYIPKAVDIDDAIFSFRQSIPKFSSRTLNTLEGIRTTDIDAKIIIEYGKGVDSLTTMQIRTIENFGQACGYLFDLVRNRKWNMDKKTICSLHAILSRDEVRNPGMFRQTPAKIDGCTYTPPEHIVLDSLFSSGMSAATTLLSIPERAIISFLFLSRSQFFEDCNKRTASLAMIGTLISNGYKSLNIDKHPKEFLSCMAGFYDNADATTIIKMFNDMAREQYSDYMAYRKNLNF
ncbi:MULTISPECIES: Fic family protein [Aminobacterium]|uniref:Fic family protein n=1 Tax=Aminobacterium TaxID=81466 RepID=UPI00257A0EA1|nr:Fic family protein [Aminobacterium sp. EBM-42]